MSVAGEEKLEVSRAGAGFLAWLVATAVSFAALLGPALWNGFPLLQFDTGGYLARWHEGYLVPSRSTVFGLFLHLGEGWHFWPQVTIQAVLTLWVMALVLRTFGLRGRPWVLAATAILLSIFTTLPWLTSILLTDIFAGLGVLSLYLLVCCTDKLRRWETMGVFLVAAFSAATHSATLAVQVALLAAGLAISSRTGLPVTFGGICRGIAAVVSGALMLLAANFTLSGTLSWTPGGYGIAFGRMLQDGIVGRYLSDHCPNPSLRLCPYRKQLPATADEFLWSRGLFNELGRFAGLGEEMRKIVLHSLVEYPGQQFTTAVAASAQQLVMIETGAGVHNKIWHTYGIIERFIPVELHDVRMAHQQRGDLDFHLLNRIHAPVAFGSLILIVWLTASSVLRRRRTDTDLFVSTIAFAILSNAFVCGALSGPHDRYGARIVWLATFAIVLLAARQSLALTPRKSVVIFGREIAIPLP